jgi:hypothetical protein
MTLEITPVPTVDSGTGFTLFLNMIPAGPQYANLRGIILEAQRNFADTLDQFSVARVQGWIDEIDSGTGRDHDQIRDDIARVIFTVERIMLVYGVSSADAELLILGGNEGGLNFADLDVAGVEPGTVPPPPEDPSVPDIPDVGEEPAGGDIPDVPSFDYQGAARLIAPWLPEALIQVFADAWAKFDDPAIALAAVRQDPTYDQFFPGIKREDGSLRMTEQEYFAQLDAYQILLLEYGLNPGIFSGNFTDLIAGDVSAGEFATRLESAFTQIVSNFDEVREVYSRFYGIEMSDEAIFASFLDEGIADAILNRRIAVSQVGGAAALQGFGLTANYAERLVNSGLSQQSALQFFGGAANQIPTLSRLATRFNDPDSSVDITEFAEAGIFQDPAQVARFRRLFAAESSSFTNQEFARFDESGAIEGLTAR